MYRHPILNPFRLKPLFLDKHYFILCGQCKTPTLLWKKHAYFGLELQGVTSCIHLGALGKEAGEVISQSQGGAQSNGIGKLLGMRLWDPNSKGYLPSKMNMSPIFQNIQNTLKTLSFGCVGFDSYMRKLLSPCKQAKVDGGS